MVMYNVMVFTWDYFEGSVFFLVMKRRTPSRESLDPLKIMDNVLKGVENGCVSKAEETPVNYPDTSKI